MILNILAELLTGQLQPSEMPEGDFLLFKLASGAGYQLASNSERRTYHLSRRKLIRPKLQKSPCAH